MDTDNDQDYDDDTPAVKAQRDRIKRLEAELAESQAAKRELAFMKAGIADTSKGQGALLLKAYDGELDPEAIRAAAIEFGVITESNDAETPPPPADEPTGSQERQGLFTGTGTPEVPASGQDLVEAGFAEFERLLKSGSAREDAFGAVLGPMFAAARAGDPNYNLSIDS